jgi:tetratricopeptide (TPR) repeat protein
MTSKRPPGSPHAAATAAQRAFDEGLARHQAGDLAAAAVAYERAIAQDAAHSDALHMRGVIAAQSLDAVGAVHWIDRALRANPRDAAAHINRGLALQALGRQEEALDGFQRASALSPDLPEGPFNAGNALLALGRPADALSSFTRAVLIRPGYAEGWYNHGTTLLALRQPEEALRSFDRAIALLPGYAEAHANRGHALEALGRAREALAAATRAVALRADYPEAQWNRALLLLLFGDYAQGLPLYELRWRVEQRAAAGEFVQARWRGDSPLIGQTILLHAEQGFGDTIQFCRYASMVRDRGGRVVLRSPRALVPVLASLEGVEQLVVEGEPLPPYDLQSPLLSLPLAFGTDVRSIPASPRYLRAAPERVEMWEQRLGPRRRLRVGLSWSSGSGKPTLLKRNVPLAELAAQLPSGIDYVSLQKEVRATDAAALTSLGIPHFGEELVDFGDTAALCELMDVVISVDTSVAHLAAAMGRPTWVLLHFLPDWRWLLDRDDSPWYPTARLFRQLSVGDWAAPLAGIAEALRVAEGGGR